MTEEQAISLITHLICHNRHLEPSQVLPDTDLREELEFDSLDAAELLAALDKEIGRQLDIASMNEVRTVSSIAKKVMRSESA